MSKGFAGEFRVLLTLIKRNMKIYLKDRMTVFFSLLAPIIILSIYFLFLGNMQYESITAALPEGLNVPGNAIKAVLDSWMVAGMLSVACITVSLNANNVMVKDKSGGRLNDLLSSPIKRRTITMSYFIFNFVVTVFICLFAFLISVIYLLLNQRFYMSAVDILAIIGTLLLSAALATSMTVLIASRLKSEASLGGLGGIVSAFAGFVIGAYMPISMFPSAVQSLIGIIPNTYSAGLFRNFLMRGALDNLAKSASQMTDALKEEYSLSMEVFGQSIGITGMIMILFGAFALFTFLNLALKGKKSKE